MRQFLHSVIGIPAKPKKRSFRVQRSLSGVFRLFSIFVAGFLLILSAELSAQNSPPPNMGGYNNSGFQMSNEVAASIARACKDAKEGEGACMQRMLKEMSGGGACTQAQQQFNAARSAFTKACTDAGISGNCIQEVMKCERCLAGGEGNGADGCDAPKISGLGGSNVSLITNNMQENLQQGIGGWSTAFDQKGIDIDKVRVKYGKCPSLAASDYKSLQKDVEEGHRKLDEEKKKILQIQEEMNKLRSDHAEEYNKNHDKLKEAERDWEKQRDEIDKKFFAENEAVMKELQQQRDLNENRKSEITNMNLKKNDEKLKRDQALSALRLKCNEIALTQVQRLQGEDMEKRRSNVQSAGGFGDVMRLAGLTSREQYQRIANDNYNQCLKSNIFTEGKENIEKSYRQALQIIDNAITKLNKDIETTTADMQRTLEVKLGQKKMEYEKDTQRADKAYTDTRQTVERNQQTADQKLQMALLAKGQALEFAKASLQREESYLKQKQQLLALKRQFTDGDSDAKSGNVGAAMSSLGDVKLGAVAVQSSCCSGGQNKPYCDGIRKYMDQIGEEMAKEETPAPAPAPAAPAAARP